MPSSDISTMIVYDTWEKPRREKAGEATNRGRDRQPPGDLP
jgi:hypothetical protein